MTKKLKLTFKGMMGEEIKETIVNLVTSPTGGYTQAYADSFGEDYEKYLAEESFGDSDWWEFQKAEYLN